jgi:DNA-binding NtrC family response regulator
MPRILIVDDDRETCRFMTELLAQPDRAIESTQRVEHALGLAEDHAYDLVISDINLEAPRNGLDVLQAFRGAEHPAQVVLISGFGTLETAIAAVRAGAFDYISKPFDIREVKATVERALAARSTSEAEAPIGQDIRPPGLQGRTAGMLTVYKQIAHAADSTAPVLILGESGTGKELVARAIHAHGRRRERPFVSVNCGAVAESLLESDLFGHVRGSFTGAVADAKGIFEQGDSGTVFLDELGDTSPGMQVKLLRVLEEGEVRPVGSHRLRHVDVRVIAATHADLERAVADERFRRDLYYRLSVIVIRVPPLRERREDIALLTTHFLQRASRRAGRMVTLSPAALAAITAHDWPGNVRELENTIERMVVFARGSMLDVDDLPFAARHRVGETLQRAFVDLPSLEEVERRYLVYVLEAVGGNRTRAAAVLGIDRRTLYRMAERYGVTLTEDREAARAADADDPA